MIFFDAHLHLSQCSSFYIPPADVEYAIATCALTKEQFEKENAIISSFPDNACSKIFRTFGIHPQMVSNNEIEGEALKKELDFLEELLNENRIDAIGECGFDFFTPEFKKTEKEQEYFWEKQIILAQSFNKPLIVHGRKCTDKFFRDCGELKKVKAVVFHSWAGTLIEAHSLLNKGINCYFSFGKPILNGRKASIECVSKLPSERIFFETDSPYMTLKNEKETVQEDLFKVYKKAEEIRGEKIIPQPDKIFI